ncbi:hypothetical protein EYF80_061710 [Liparis tanakae]|uniref:Uncharacterized protein n=1 Tax=Liparis tanakae TaxID=230148 RepID=A0A4Z2EH79_9TELE|nr:hypothetical protein EYF80_061710 [Liparis tanakae]
MMYISRAGRVASVLYVPVLHAGELGRGLLEVVVVAVGEGAQAASDQRHGAEASAGLAGRVGAGGALLAVLAVTRRLQPVVRTRKGHLHGCWRGTSSRSETSAAASGSLKEGRSFSVPGPWMESSLLLCEGGGQRSSPLLPGAAGSHGSHRQERWEHEMVHLPSGGESQAVRSGGSQSWSVLGRSDSTCIYERGGRWREMGGDGGRWRERGEGEEALNESLRVAQFRRALERREVKERGDEETTR